MLKSEKQLSFGERKMYDQAHGLVVQECVIAKEITTEKIEKEIENIFTV
jgi:CarD family transcriptional regulator